eukprot:CAMPEP_0183789628 /NCGR_PEP_ID=MMETSP0803_2-20130417/539_1 /TAXON_ID=195967 /ORGANISM="Crustomastix stigmata, Strain CCMP3273" /LENGTH=674 /DNA_ID=CAMNT_0026033803 /DNA_START=122 /DNA_END=2143 /DNA_ORIENTATION=-
METSELLCTLKTLRAHSDSFQAALRRTPHSETVDELSVHFFLAVEVMCRAVENGVRDTSAVKSVLFSAAVKHALDREELARLKVEHQNEAKKVLKLRSELKQAEFRRRRTHINEISGNACLSTSGKDKNKHSEHVVSTISTSADGISCQVGSSSATCTCNLAHKACQADFEPYCERLFRVGRNRRSKTVRQQRVEGQQPTLHLRGNNLSGDEFQSRKAKQRLAIVSPDTTPVLMDVSDVNQHILLMLCRLQERLLSKLALSTSHECLQTESAALCIDSTALVQAVDTFLGQANLNEFMLEFFLSLHGSHGLALKHFNDFCSSMKICHVDSGLAHIFARLFDMHTPLQLHSKVFIIILVGQTLSDLPVVGPRTVKHVPLVQLDGAKKAITLTFQAMLGTTPSLCLDDLYAHAAECILVEDGGGTRPHIELGTLLDMSLAAWSKQNERSREYLFALFHAHHPEGSTLLQVKHLKSIINVLAPQCPQPVILQMFRQISELASETCSPLDRQMSANMFVQVVQANEMYFEKPASIKHLCVKPISTCLEAPISLAVLRYAWGIAKKGLDGWLRRWHSAREGLPTVVQPLSEEEKAVVVQHIVKLCRLQTVMDVSIVAASSLIHQGGSKHDVEAAWINYTSAVCEMESAVMAHRKSIGILDSRIVWDDVVGTLFADDQPW